MGIVLTEEAYFRTFKFIHGYTTHEGWAHNEHQFRWDLHDMRNQVRAWITDEALWPLRQGTPGMRRIAQERIVERFGVPLPELEST